LSDSNIARPFLFQNSLHNSTTGFLSLHLNIQGPTFTICHPQDPWTKALELSDQILSAQQCEYTCVVMIDLNFPFLEEIKKTRTLSTDFFGAKSIFIKTHSLKKSNKSNS
jgi:hypothetical protein